MVSADPLVSSECSAIRTVLSLTPSAAALTIRLQA